MTNEEQRTPQGDQPGDEVPVAGPEANASGPAPQDEDLTVDDILSTEQDASAAGDPGAAAEAENPYLEDLRRITAEYANYRKRTEANAAIEKQRATAAAVLPMLSVLDDLDRAEQHGDLEEGSAFATIATKIRSTFERLGLESFGEKGEPFDPQLHEAIAQVPVPGTESETVLDVIERGYRIGDVELRPAKVAVAVGG
ncbi:nucleotide exchange factor GrpE [Leucobacter sp. HNU]|uniref:nucleotide exchange factor GrpE n=1 Tax=Leucobacter sp. HNU TaxID=3236805 RepID=UPI003A8012DE